MTIKVTVTSTLEFLESDLKHLAVQTRKDMRDTVRDGIKVGNTVAKDNARRSAGRHGKHYHRAFTAEMRSDFHGFGSSVFSGEYGPDISKPQGGMSFERGSRNQPPHLDLARSADAIGPAFARKVAALPSRWFW